MSESAPERGGGADSFFSRKYGPLPGWGWALIAAGGAGAYILYKRKHAATTSAATTADGSGIPYDYAPQIATLQQEIQDLQSGAGQSPTIPPALSTSGGNVSGFTPQPGTPTEQPSSNPQASFTGAPVAAAVFAAPSASAGTSQVTATRTANRAIIPTTPQQTVRTPLPMGISVNNARILGIIGPRQTAPAPTIVAGSRPPQNLPAGLSVNNARRLGL